MKAVSRLGLHTQSTQLPITGTQETAVASSNEKVTVELQMDNQQSISFTFYVVQQVIRNLPIIAPAMSLKTEFKDLPLADPQFFIPSEVDALFGVQVWIKIVKPRIIRTNDGSGIAQLTRMGYVVFQNPNAKKGGITTGSSPNQYS